MKKIKEEGVYFAKPIKLTDKVSIYQPTLKEIIENGYSLEELIEPFITLDKQNFEEDKDNSELNNFDIFFLQILMWYINVLKNNEKVELGDWLNSPLSNGLVIKRLIRVFKFLFRTEDVNLYISKGIADDMNENYIMINKSYKIDSQYKGGEDKCRLICTDDIDYIGTKVILTLSYRKAGEGLSTAYTKEIIIRGLF